MACGSVYAAEVQLSRDISKLDITRPDLTHHPKSPPRVRNGDVHEAIRFLQAEHEKVLTGLHQEIRSLQQKCDDLQFDAHLSHITATGEEKLQSQLDEVTENLRLETLKTETLENILKQHDEKVEDEREQFRWREVQLQQQIDVGEHKVTELKDEIARLKSQVHDLRVYNSAVINSNNRTKSPRPSTSDWPGQSISLQRSQSRSSRASIESLDSGPKSIGSEDGEAGYFREARLGSSLSLQNSTRSFRSMKNFSSQKLNSSLPHFSPTCSTPALPPIRCSTSRPASSVTLPPIAQSLNKSRSQVRKQLRLSSAPVLNHLSLKPKTSNDPL